MNKRIGKGGVIALSMVSWLHTDPTVTWLRKTHLFSHMQPLPLLGAKEALGKVNRGVYTWLEYLKDKVSLSLHFIENRLVD